MISNKFMLIATLVSTSMAMSTQQQMVEQDKGYLSVPGLVLDPSQLYGTLTRPSGTKGISIICHINLPMDKLLHVNIQTKTAYKIFYRVCVL
ncbi:hypothetical protein BDF22DRAFT_664712 [Syncephalis plumigaleata]|nr:hypothetical protein BDF22DRAFT_664712 [Syncephalis plumigaleata]